MHVLSTHARTRLRTNVCIHTITHVHICMHTYKHIYLESLWNHVDSDIFNNNNYNTHNMLNNSLSKIARSVSFLTLFKLQLKMHYNIQRA